ncbi:MAG: serine/threonine-protein kinase [Lachnospiraceae bacterium]
MDDSRYKELEILDESGNTSLVKDLENGKLYVKKHVSDSLKAVYLKLQEAEKLHITQIEGVWESLEQNGMKFCIVLEEFVQGITLEQLMARGNISQGEVIEYTIQLCQALSAVHALGIIHRDIKPSNIMLNQDGVIKLIDFGIARIVKPKVSEDTTLLGTRGYAAPEQYGFGQSERYTDIYAAGVLMNVLLTGKLPSDELYQGDCRSIIQKCINLNPKERFQYVSQLEGCLIGLREQLDGKERATKRRRLMLLIGGIVFGVALLGGMLLKKKYQDETNIIYVTNSPRKSTKYVFHKEPFPFDVYYSDEFKIIGEIKTNHTYSVNLMHENRFLSIWIVADRIYEGYENGEEIYNFLKKSRNGNMVYYEDIKKKGVAISSSTNDIFENYYAGDFVQCIDHEIAFTRDDYLIYIKMKVPVSLSKEYKKVVTNLLKTLDANEQYVDKGRTVMSDEMKESIAKETYWIEESTVDPSDKFGRIMETENLDEYTEETQKVYEEVDLHKKGE